MLIQKSLRLPLVAGSRLILKRHSHSIQPVTLAYTSYEKLIKTDIASQDPPLLVLHGLFGSKSNWNSLCKAIHAKTLRKVIAIDARNHGESTHSDVHNYPAMAADVAHFLDTMKIDRVSLIGHSMGGRAFVNFALSHPNRVESAVIVDISPRPGLGTSRTNIPLFLHAMKSLQVPNEYTIHQGRKMADDLLSKIIDDKSLRDFLITNLVKTDDGSFRWRLNLDALEKNFDDHIANFPDMSGKQYRGPALFVAGSKSDYVKESDLPLIKSLFPNSELKFLDSGHWVHAEKPAEFLNVVIDFLQRTKDR